MPPTAQKSFTPLPSPKGTCRMRPQARLKPFLFRILEKLDYFSQVSTDNIAEYQLQCTSIGKPYLQAKIRTSHQRLVVSGDILTELLPRCRPALINDLLLVLQYLGEFHYNTWEQGQQRRLLSKSSHRTLHTLSAQTLLLFLEFSSPFQSKCLDLLNNSGNFPQRNFLSVAAAAREPPSMRATHKFDDLSLAIDPSILEEMAKLKQTL
ncbi:uncharacterized protein LOC129241881 [Anastrepha obliqua]|uniref:uncharacterized protein LOC129241881 n=1 Tax=Anastrepha obliqua TaxID=95512 RepID=UPI002409EC04|nr:uncharacterized protein LOC129241881 [Anastrepha obliqua]